MTPTDLLTLILRPQRPRWRVVDHIPAQVIARRVERGIMGYEDYSADPADPDLVLEKHCPSCEDDWPADSEFFNRCGKSPDGLSSLCRACSNEARKRRK